MVCNVRLYFKGLAHSINIDGNRTAAFVRQLKPGPQVLEKYQVFEDSILRKEEKTDIRFSLKNNYISLFPYYIELKVFDVGHDTYFSYNLFPVDIKIKDRIFKELETYDNFSSWQIDFN
jgi:hypothetical protein